LFPSYFFLEIHLFHSSQLHLVKMAARINIQCIPLLSLLFRGLTLKHIENKDKYVTEEAGEQGENKSKDRTRAGIAGMLIMN
jgi:hypothetical protein